MVVRSRDGSGNGKRPDGRRNNIPPERTRIQPGEIRNRWGRAGKPAALPPTSIDELFWQEANRIVSQDEHGPVDAKKRLVQEEFHAALMDNDGSVRARLLAQLHVSGARIDGRQQEILAFFIEGKARLTGRFYEAEKSGRPPPDILPHPDHVEIFGDQVHFLGPTDKRGRANWEWIKSAITVAACCHQIARDEVRRTGCPDARQQLREIEKHRRRLMRCVPRGWNWREVIYCRDSKFKFTQDLVRDLKEKGYVKPQALD